MHSAADTRTHSALVKVLFIIISQYWDRDKPYKKVDSQEDGGVVGEGDRGGGEKAA